MQESNGIEVSGLDWKAFCKCGTVWAEATHWDDTLIFVDGVHVEDDADDVSDSAVVRVESGFLVDPVTGAPEDLVDCIEWWLAKRQSVRMLVEVPKDGAEALKAAIVAAGGRVVAG